ncbi:hypothetical protein CHLNCDRAFT_48540 [Chlorella variabilis]|uniref:Selenocysteine-specific elongation factor n=1 Tax=Chlorella variabilis TaxID=554065 RepID=E1Z5S9_CHLVA|nr:hypothetical protein CHLNCDRAFT_48540 [Chlorella variabilis]EFN58810.1 hypothetical protein CHLNCDRAFT_48540 [Chlorella variabilis]|eukprot:XP_005850912.1 hypothetical protein CHLNCDRAFT_48540 [Chlorella variabilis]
MPAWAVAAGHTYNVNVGVLGHVDSGKTSLVAALSTTLSTAALDKHPQSRERGITLDLGFSSFMVPAPPQIQAAGYSHVQFTLVDCPGHASLIRTIIGGAQIIDLMVLVVDASKGIQTQTAECIVIGEVAAADMVVALNKIDQFPAEKQERYCRKAQKLVAATLTATKFAGCPIVPVAARPGAGGAPVSGGEADAAPIGVQQLVNTLLQRVQLRQPTTAGNGSGRAAATEPFLFFIDHCFAIKGQGTVMTGTVMRGSVRVGDPIELPELRVQKKVKSMQMFRQPIQVCSRGDRLGICVTQLDAKQVERGLACTPGTVPTFEAAVAAVEKIRFYSGEVRSRSKMHITVGHVTAFDSSRDYLYQDFLYGLEGRPAASGVPAAGQHPADHQQQRQQQDDGQEGQLQAVHHGVQWAYLRFSQPVTAAADSLIIGSKLDADLHTSTCRLAFYGRICCLVDPSDQRRLRRLLPVYKPKQREGAIERIEADGCTAVCRGMFQKETDLALFTGMRVVAAPGGQEGRIEGGFGKSGKFKVHFRKRTGSGPCWDRKRSSR